MTVFPSFHGFNHPHVAAAAAAGIISSIQQVEITIATDATTGTATISSVDTSRTAVFFSYGHGGGARQISADSGVDSAFCRVDLTNATTVTASRGSFGSAVDKTLIVTVIQYTAAAIDSVQQGTIDMAESVTSNTDTISSVTTSRSVVLYNGSSITVDVAEGSAMTRLSLTNATTVTVNRDVASATTHTATTGYVVIEFAAGVTDSIQEFSITILTAGGTSNTATISSVVTSNTTLFAGGMTTTGVTADLGHEMSYAQLTNATTVTTTKTTASGSDLTMNGTMVEFAAGIIESIERGVTTMAGDDLTKDTTITAIVLAQSIVQAGGLTSTSTTSVDPEEQFFTLEFTSTTNIRASIGATGSERDVIFSFEVVEYAS